MFDSDIIKITKYKNCVIENTFEKVKFYRQNILKVDFRDKESRFIDLISNFDITEIDYLEIIKFGKGKILFEECE